jgi:TPR repeat protein
MGILTQRVLIITLARTRQSILVVFLIVSSSGCTTTEGMDTVRPSFLLRSAYVTNRAPNVQGIQAQRWEAVLPKRHTDFDPERDPTLVFVLVFSSPEALTFKGDIKSPDGAVWRRFDRNVQFLEMWRGRFVGSSFWREYHLTFRTSDMAKNPGRWSVEFFLNGAQTGIYRFWVGDPATVARLKQQDKALAYGISQTRTIKPDNSGEPVSVLRRRAAAGDGRAMAQLGFLYFTGRGGLTKDDREAVRWFRDGAQAGNGLAMSFLGSSYWVGMGGLPKDEVEAVRWFRKGADASDGRAQAMLGQTYLTGGGGLPRDEAQAVRWFRQGAESSDGRAMAMLGQMYLTGEGGVVRNETEGARWLRKAADAGDGLAMVTLGTMYEEGEGGLRKDDVEAVTWYRKGTEVGAGRAMAHLGTMYSTGRGGLPRNEVEAIKWYRAGADLFDAVAMFELGRAYEEGKGIPRSDREARRWYRQSASLGLPEAMDRLHELGEE